MLRTAIATGILTTIIHFSNTELFEPVAELVWSHAENVDLQNDTAVFTSAELMFTVAGVRKGNRVKDWPRMHNCLSRFVLSDTSEQWTDATKQKVVTSFAIMLAYSNVLSDGKLNVLFNALQSGAWQAQFLHLCDFLARLDAARFERYVLKRMQSHLSSTELSGEQLEAWLSILPRTLPASNQSIKLSNDSVAESITTMRDHLLAGSSASEEDMSKVLVVLNALPFLNLPQTAKDKMLDSLNMAMQQANEDSSKGTMFRKFVIGPCAQALQTFQPIDSGLLELYSEILCSAVEECKNLEIYWTNMRSLASICHAPLANFVNIQQSMLQALSSSSHAIREAVLDTIQILLTRQKQEIPQALLTAILVESTPISMETSRAISMNIRRIGAEYADIKSDSLIAQAIPAYCFGLLHIRLSQAWTDVIATLGEIAKTSVGEDFIMKTAESWLQGGEDIEQAQIPTLVTASAPRIQVFSDFECPNLTRLNTMSQQIFQDDSSGYPSPQNDFIDVTRDIHVVNSESRGQCLKVLSSLAQLAEKRSRLLVPTLLQWAGSSAADEDDTSSKAALQAILAWKETAITRYREHLSNILDDTRFREELSVFLQGDDEDGLRHDDQPQVLPILLRLLYGYGNIIDVALSSTSSITFVNEKGFRQESIKQLKMPLRQQVGMLNMLGDLLATLGSGLQPVVSKILDPILGCTITAQRRLDDVDSGSFDVSLLRSVRQNELDSKAKIVSSELLLPRAIKFVEENTEGISSSLQLISSLTANARYLPSLYVDEGIVLSKVADLLGHDQTKIVVKLLFSMRL
ncbi:hypothetical protein MRB53_038812 [Persea americana]|nr:hypothetical protein MRB53_038812 [Persea americana]